MGDADDGSLHELDQLAAEWQVHGGGFDAAAYADADGSHILFFAGRVLSSTAIGLTTSPNCFQMRRPACSLASTAPPMSAATCTCFGRACTGGQPATPPTHPAALGKLSDMSNWPTSSNWQLGLVDAVAGHGDSSVAFVRGNEVIIVDFGQGEVKLSPIPLSEGYGGELSKLLGSGALDAAVRRIGLSASVPLAAFQDAAVLAFAGTQAPPPAPAYVAALYGTDQLRGLTPGIPYWRTRRWVASVICGPSRCGAVLHDTGDGWVDASLPMARLRSASLGRMGRVRWQRRHVPPLRRGRAGGTFRVERYRMVTSYSWRLVGCSEGLRWCGEQHAREEVQTRYVVPVTLMDGIERTRLGCRTWFWVQSGDCIDRNRLLGVCSRGSDNGTVRGRWDMG